MDLEHYRRKLLAKEKELLEDMAHTGSEALQTADVGVRDEMDLVVDSEAKDALLHQNSQDYDLLQQVRDALHRIDDGTYGKCLKCGRPIEAKRLEAVPWAAYDLQHQEQADRAESRTRGGATL